MRKLFMLLMFVVPVISLTAQSVYVSDKLVKKWETPAELKVPESAYYDAARQVIYVSNVTGSPTDEDGTGFISKVSPEGKIVELHWVTGLNAPKGMGVSDGFLYVSDISRVIKIDIATGKIAETLNITGAQFLNDIATDPQQNVYISDMNGNAIYMLRDGKYEVLVKSDQFTGVNGLFFADGNLLAGLHDKVVSINLKTRAVTDFILNTGGIDGLVSDGLGNYLISDWSGTIHLINPGKDKVKLLDTKPASINAADIDFIVAKKLLLVPTFSDNRLVAYELK